MNSSYVFSGMLAQMLDVDGGLKYGNDAQREMQRMQFKYKQDGRGYGFGIDTVDDTTFVGHGGGIRDLSPIPA